jgi:hypothetical protein
MAEHDEDALMAITRTSLWSGITRTMHLPITPEQLERWHAGMVIQNAMPHLTTAEREFVVSGMTSEEWQEMAQMEDTLNGETEARDLGELHRRMDAMHQASEQGQHRGHDQGMGV